MIVRSGPKHALQALTEIVFLEDAAGPVVAFNQALDEGCVPCIPAIQCFVGMTVPARKSLVVHRPQIDRPDASALEVRDEFIDIRWLVHIDGGERRNSAGSEAANGLIEVGEELAVASTQPCADVGGWPCRRPMRC